MYQTFDDYLRHRSFLENIKDEIISKKREIAHKSFNSVSREKSMSVLKDYLQEKEFELYDIIKDKQPHLIQPPYQVIALLFQLNAESESA